jgi:hypothetical protein
MNGWHVLEKKKARFHDHETKNFDLASWLASAWERFWRRRKFKGPT